MSQLTKSTLPEDILKLVQRTVVVPDMDKDGKTQKRHAQTKALLFKDKLMACKADEVLDYKVTGNTLVVVTTDGQKIRVTLDDKQVAELTPANENTDSNAE